MVFSFKNPKNHLHSLESLATFSFVSRGSDEGTFDCDNVVESLTILGMERKPSSVAVRLSGEDLTCVR